MYNYLDYDNDRHRVRERFVNEMNQKTTLEDIGGLLDKFILDSQAATGQYFDPKRHLFEKPNLPQRDLTESELDFRKTFIQGLEENTPEWLEDPT